MNKKLQRKIQLEKSYEQDLTLDPHNYFDKPIFNIICVILFILIGVVIYSNSFKCSFHFDDNGSIINNPQIRELYGLKSWWNYSPNRLIPYYSFALNYHFGKYDVWGYHLVNLIIHLINTCLVWWLAMLMFTSPVLKNHGIAKHKTILAFFIGLLFLTHPLATQSVTYIVQRLASMAAMFYLFSILFYLLGRFSEKGLIWKTILFTATGISGLFAMLSKENALTLPFAIILVELFFIHKGKLKVNFKDYRIWILLISLIGFIFVLISKFSFSIFKPIPPTQLHDYALTPLNYLFTQFSVIIKYIQLLILPVNQMVDYDFPISNSFLEIRTFLSFLLLLALIGVGIFLFNKQRLISFGIFWFFLTISVESSIIPIKDVIFEHRTYLPSFGFFIIFTTGIFLIFGNKNKNIAFIIMGVIIGFFAFQTYQRNKVWENDYTLWNDNVKKAPNNARAYTNRGLAYKRSGKWDEALEDYMRALELKPKYSIALSDRGVVYAHYKQWDKAIADYTKAIEINPQYTDALSNRGAAFCSVNEWEKAIADFSKAIKLDPNYASAYYNRGIAYGNILLQEKAIKDFTKAIAIKPDYTNAFSNRGIIYAALKQFDKAIADYNSAIEIDPNHFLAHSNRGDAYAGLLEWEQAIRDYSRAIAINPNNANTYFNRAHAYEQLKNWDKAVDDYAKTIELDPENKDAYKKLENAFAKFIKTSSQ